MARPKKPGFDSFDLTTEFFTDSRVRGLHSSLGSDAVLVLLSIYMRAFRHTGYYLQNGPTSLYLVLGDVPGISGIAFVQQVIDASLSLGIFDRHLYQDYNILTSPYLQQAYVDRCRVSKRRNIVIDERYRLIVIEEDQKKKANPRKKINIPDLSRMIVQGWNMTFSAHPDRVVPDDMQSDPVFIDCLKELIEKYPDYAEIDPWFAIFRNALLHHPEFHLASVVCDEPNFRILFDEGEPADYIPGECSPPRGMIHPAIIQEARMKRSGCSEEEVTEGTSRLLERQPEVVSEMPVITEPKPVENNTVMNVYVTNEAPDPSEDYYPDDIDDEYPEEEENHVADVLPDGQYVHEYDPELTPLLHDILLLYRTKYQKQRYADVESLLVDEDMFSQEKHALDYLRAYIEQDERCRDLAFWDTLIDGIIHLQRFRNHHCVPESPRDLFDVETACRWGLDSDMSDRLRLMRYHIWYFTDPDRNPEPTARDAGKQFMTILEMEKNNQETKSPDHNEGPVAGDVPSSVFTDVDKEQQKDRFDSMTTIVSSTTEGWLEERILHPEEFKDPTKPYGDRTAPMPWAKKNPKHWETLKEDDGFCHDMAHGKSIRMKD